MMIPGRRSSNLIDAKSIPVLDRKGLRHFGIVTGAMFAGLFGLFFPWLLGLAFPIWPWIVLAVLGGLGLIVPEVLRPVYYGWMRFAILMSRITTPIILGILYYVIITPMALGMRLLGKDPLKRKYREDIESYRINSEIRKPADLEKPF